jgi:hypothetical protein
MAEGIASVMMAAGVIFTQVLYPHYRGQVGEPGLPALGGRKGGPHSVIPALRYVPTKQPVRASLGTITLVAHWGPGIGMLIGKLLWDSAGSNLSQARGVGQH